ncbi:hypothetical protein [Frondihabitans sucicola]|uniref:hypothetical protein n=1 Tax=Frondihabitans sucicola TaxID=1268041 RepID=UPI0025724AFE|nr:hypothetical protein [Frondihabitans sucicola]
MLSTTEWGRETIGPFFGVGWVITVLLVGVVPRSIRPGHHWIRDRVEPRTASAVYWFALAAALVGIASGAGENTSG